MRAWADITNTIFSSKNSATDLHRKMSAPMDEIVFNFLGFWGKCWQNMGLVPTLSRILDSPLELTCFILPYHVSQNGTFERTKSRSSPTFWTSSIGHLDNGKFPKTHDLSIGSLIDLFIFSYFFCGRWGHSNKDRTCMILLIVTSFRWKYPDN